MTMTTPDARLQSIGASFAVQYYTTLVESPETLASLYTPSAHVVHSLAKANGAAEISSLLASLITEGVTSVKLEDVVSAPGTSGSIKVSVKGEFISVDRTQPFIQEVGLQELQKNTYGITSDQLTYSSAQQKTVSAAETAVGKAAPKASAAAAAVAVAAAKEKFSESPKDAAKTADAQEPAAAAPSGAPAADTAAATNAPSEAADESSPVPPMRPASFAEALRRKGAGGSVVASSGVAVRVLGGKTRATEDKKTKKVSSDVKKEQKPASQSATSAKSKVALRPQGGSAPELYDIILKDLPESITKEEVRAVVEPVATVKLVNLVKSERRRRSKETTSEMVTSAFVQLKRPVGASATYVKDVLTKLKEVKKDVRIEEVQEKKSLSTAPRKMRDGGAAVPKKTAKV